MKRSLFQEKEEFCENCECNCKDEEYCTCVCECDEDNENKEDNKNNEQRERKYDHNTQNKKIKNMITLDEILKNNKNDNKKINDENIDYMDIDIDIETIEKLKNKYNSQKKYEPLNNQIKIQKINKILNNLNNMLNEKQNLTKLDKLIVHEYTKEIKDLINN